MFVFLCGETTVVWEKKTPSLYNRRISISLFQTCYIIILLPCGWIVVTVPRSFFPARVHFQRSDSFLISNRVFPSLLGAIVWLEKEGFIPDFFVLYTSRHQAIMSKRSLPPGSNSTHKIAIPNRPLTYFDDLYQLFQSTAQTNADLSSAIIKIENVRLGHLMSLLPLSQTVGTQTSSFSSLSLASSSSSYI